MMPKLAEPEAPRPGNPVGATGLVFSALGLGGWCIVLLIMLSIPYEERTGDGQRDLFIGLSNLFLFFVRLAIGLVGTSTNGTLCFVGLILSILGLKYEPRRMAQVGLGLSVAGILLGGALVTWRLAVFGFFQ